MSTIDRINVAAGILVDATGKVLLTERIGDSPFIGLWEFPGGKIHSDETPVAAVQRELLEELGIRAGECEYFMSVKHEYVDRFVALEFFLIRDWQGVPAGLDGQALRWCDPAELETAELLPADAPVLLALQRQSKPPRNASAF